jgi:hypothetical protein
MIVRRHKRKLKNSVSVVRQHARRKNPLAIKKIPVTLVIPGVNAPKDYIKTYKDKPRKREDNFTLYDIL